MNTETLTRVYRCIVIDPKNQAVTEESITADGEGLTLQALYKRIDCVTVDLARIHPLVDLWVDDEGLLRAPEHVRMFKLAGRTLAGVGVMLDHDDEGNTADLPPFVTLDDVRALVRWVR
jgi:hypothetical protein